MSRHMTNEVTLANRLRILANARAPEFGCETMHQAADELDGWSILAELRSKGWIVAVHNDYRQHGILNTFWLLTKGNRCVKGEASSDLEALTLCRNAIGDMEAEALSDE